jgi:hypothetical protein
MYGFDGQQIEGLNRWYRNEEFRKRYPGLAAEYRMASVLDFEREHQDRQSRRLSGDRATRLAELSSTDPHETDWM